VSAPGPAKPVRAAQSAETRSWGVVSREGAKAYTTNGKFLGKLQAGTILSILSVRKTKTGRVAVCTLQVSGDKDKLLVRTSELEMRRGLLEKAGEKEKDLTIKAAKLQAAIGRARSGPEETVAANNPHAGAYAEVKKKHAAFWKKVSALEARHEAADGEERMRYFDELRRLKGEDIRIGTELESVKKKYDAWNRQHRPARVDTPEIRALESELQDVRYKLREIGSQS